MMEMILFWALVVLEIALAVISMANGKEKKQWYQTRLFIRIAQVAFFAGSLVLPQISLSFRFAALFALLMLRLAIALAGYLIRQRKAQGHKRVAGLVAAALVGVLILRVAFLPALMFNDYQGLPVTGSYEVKMASAIVVDDSRMETFETDGSRREVPVYFYYPDNAANCPLVLFSHGAFGFYDSNYSTYAELASHGYVVVALDHPYHSFFTADTAGKPVIVNIPFVQNVMMCTEGDVSVEEEYRLSSEWLALRVDDMNFVLDTIKAAAQEGTFSSAWHLTDAQAEAGVRGALDKLDAETIGLMGHSLGGAASVTLGRTRSDVDAVIDLDGSMLGERLSCENGGYTLYDEAYPIPVLEVANADHHQQRLAEGEGYVNVKVMNHALKPSYTWFEGSGHMNFTDLPLLSPVLAEMLGTGSADAQTCVETMNAVVLHFFDYYLKGEGELNIQPVY